MEFILIYIVIGVLTTMWMDIHLQRVKQKFKWYWLPIILVASTWIISYPLCRFVIYRQGKSSNGK